jgi:hypothetical protein
MKRLSHHTRHAGSRRVAVSAFISPQTPPPLVEG